MLILVEGPDGSGKSTLCETLLNRGYASVEAKISRFQENVFDLYFELSKIKKDIIFDRSFISDLVYRIQDGNSAETMSLDDMCFILKRCKIIYCYNNNAFDDAMNRGEDNIVDKAIHDELHTIYEYIMRMIETFTHTEVLRYNHYVDDIDIVYDFIGKEE